MKQVTTLITQSVIKNTLKTRTIEFNREFDREYIQQIVSLMHKIKRYDEIKQTKDSKKIITFNIYTYGGSIYSLLALLDTIDMFRADGYKINTKTMGISASCGFVLSIYGDERYMTKNSYLLNHQGSSIAHGTLKDIEVSYKSLKQLEKRINGIIKQKTNFTDEELMRPYNENIDIIYDSDDCLKWGVVDLII